MPYNPSQPVVIKAELFIFGAWINVTTRSRAAGNVWIKQAGSDGANQPETSRCRVTLGNDDGWLTEDNPFSPWAGEVGRGTQIRLSVTGILAGDAGRFAGFVDRMEAVYPGGASSAMFVEAIGTWGELAQNDEELRSPMFRSTAGVGVGDYVPFFYCSLEDPAGSTRFASGLAGGTTMSASGSVSFAAVTDMVGSKPLPSFAAGATAFAVIPSYTDTGLWAWQVCFKVESIPAADTQIAEFKISGGLHSKYVIHLDPGDPFPIRLDGVNASSGLVDAGIGMVAGGTTLNNWIMASFAEAADGSDVFCASGFEYFVGRTLNSPGSSQTVTGAPGKITSIALSGAAGVSFGHPAMFTDPAYSWANDRRVAAGAMNGWDAETVEDRLARIGREENLNIVVLGGSLMRMGPQPDGRVTDVLADCQQVDQGLWSDSRTDTGLVYRTSAHLATQVPRIAVQRGSLTPDTQPVWDYQQIHNEWTVSRSGGSSATVSDEDHVAKIRRRVKGSAPNLNIADDDDLEHQAGWRVNIGTAPGPRYPILGIDLRNSDGAMLADAVLNTDVGDRMTAAAAAFPSQHPPGGADQLILGWEEELDADFWEFRPVTQPYRPYDLVGRWALLSHQLHAAINSTTTSIDIANTSTSQPMLETDAAKVGSGYGITIGLEELHLTSVTASAITYGGVGTVAHAVNASVTPGLPASLAQGDLMVMLACIRNFGAGTPNTPSGWYKYPVFPSSANVQIFGKIAGASESAPTVTFSGSVAGADTSAQIIRLQGKWHDVTKTMVDAAATLNPSAQDVKIPGIPKNPDIDDHIIIRAGWKQDDWTSVAHPDGSPTEISEPSTTTGDDQAFFWTYRINTVPATAGASTSVVTGGAAAISRAAILMLRCDYQSATVQRAVNNVAASHSELDAVTMTDPMRWGLQ